MNRNARARFAGAVLAVAVAVGPLTSPPPAPQSTSSMLVAPDVITDSTGDGTGGVTFGSYARAQVDAQGGPEHGRGTSEPVLDAGRLKLAESYGKLPLSFEANQGQTDSRVRFLSRGNGYSLFLTPTEAVLTLRGPAEAGSSGFHAAPGPAERAALPPNGGAVLRMKLLGSNPAPRATGLEELPGKSNYFIGNDPKQWRTGVPNYGKVRFESVYPGVDLVYYGNQRQLEYDFVVAPGADPSAITLGFAGAERLEIDSQGELALQTSAGEVRWHKPVVYQEVGGVRQMVDGHYVRKGKEAVGFEVASYDPRHALIIDPVLIYSTYLGGSSGPEYGRGIAADSSGNAYVTGITQSADFPIFPNPGAFQPALNGFQNAFVTKLNAAGSALVYSTYLGGSGFDEGNGIAVDSSGNAYVTGSTFSIDFPTLNAFQSIPGSNGDAFVTKLNAAGSALVYSTYLGGSFGDDGFAIAVDSSGNAYVTGLTRSAVNFPKMNAFQPAFGGGTSDAFVTKLNTTLMGNPSLVYSTYLGGSGDENSIGAGGAGIAADSSGNAYVTGQTFSANFPIFPNPGALDTTFGGGTSDAFVTKLNTTLMGNPSLVYSTYLGGSGQDIGRGVAVDISGNAYVAGATGSTDFPTLNAFQSTVGGAFVTKLNATGSALVYSTHLGGISGVDAVGIAVDSSVVPPNGFAYITGLANSGSLATSNAFQPAFGGGTSDAFVAKFDTALSGSPSLVYFSYLGGTGFDQAWGIAVDSSGNAYVTGRTRSLNFPPANAFQAALGGFEDAFVSKIGEAGLALVSISVTPADPTIVQGATLQFTATGTFSDSSTQDLTNSVTWSSDTSSVATITAGPGGGLATGIGTGTSLITATSDSISGSTTLTVIAPPSAPPSIAKVFGAAVIPLGGNTGLTFTLGNPNSTTLSGVTSTTLCPPG